MENDPHILSPTGILDGPKGTALLDDVHAALKAGFRAIRIDMQDITFMDSAGFGYLVMALKSVKQSGGGMSLLNVNSQVRLVLELTGTDQVLTMLEA
jgi:anti-anti-sigma factor